MKSNFDELPNGYRVLIEPDDFMESECLHYSGVGAIKSKAKCKCPNCNNLMFPAINLSFKDPALKKLNLWVHNELHILICPFCSHYMEPYWIIHDDDSVTIKGGNKDDGEILQNIVTPYEARKIKLMPLTESDYPIDSERERGLVSRQVGEGVYHQIGGLPIKGSDISIHCCECNDEMKFMGILDYDDLNIPLYENNMEPVSLIIGDYDCLNFYSCNKCGVVGLSWAR